MSRRDGVSFRHMLRRSLVVFAALAACGPATPQPGSPSQPPSQPPAAGAPAAPPANANANAEVSRWSAKLDDPREAERAVAALEKLGDPRAIPALGKAWGDGGRSPRLIQVIVSLAKPLTPQEAAAAVLPAYEKAGRPAHWDDALPFLRRAIVEVDVASPRSVESAAKAADAIGEARLAAATPALSELARRPVSKKLVATQVAAIRALGKLADDRARAAAALIEIVDREPPPRPRGGSEHDRAQRTERLELALVVTGGAINALGELRAEAAIGSLVLAMYKLPELNRQLRRALVAIGPGAAGELRKILRGEHAAVNQLFQQEQYSKYCDPDRSGGPCLPVSAKQFYPATVLGDFHDAAAVRDLLAVLKDPPLPAYYLSGDGDAEDRAGPTQHVAVMHALGKIGSPEAAKPVYQLWHGVKAPRRGELVSPVFQTKLLAIVKYPYLARDLTGVEELARIAADNGADRESEYHDELRQVAVAAYARLSRDPKGIAILQGLAKRYLDASAQRRAEADRQKPGADAADKEYDAKKKAVEAMKVALIELTKDANATADQIRAATAAVKQAETDLKAAKLAHREKTRPFKDRDGLAKAYLSFARMFQIHIARIEIAIRCKEELSCFAASLRLTPDDAAKNVLPYIKDVFDWTPDHKRELVAAAVERAMLELGKRGAQAQGLTTALLDKVATDQRTIREGILFALPKIAKLPCAECVEKLDLAIRADEGRSARTELTAETEMLRNYFAQAGTK